MIEAKHSHAESAQKCPICKALQKPNEDLYEHIIVCSAEKARDLSIAVAPSPLADDFDVKNYTLVVKVQADRKQLSLSLTHNTSKHVFSAAIAADADELDDLHAALQSAANNSQFALSKPTDEKRRGRTVVLGHAYYLQPVGTEIDRLHRINQEISNLAKKQGEELASLRAADSKQGGESMASITAKIQKHDDEVASLRALTTKQGDELASMRAINTKQGEELASQASALFTGADIAAFTAKMQKQDEELAVLKAGFTELKSRPAPAASPAPAPLPVVVSSPSTAPSEVKSTITAGAKPKLLLTIGSSGSGDGQFSAGPYGVAVSPVDGKIWVAGNKVHVFSPDGKFLFEAAKGAINTGYGIAFAANGEAYIADRNAACIIVCRPDGSVVRKIGSKGSGNGQFNNPIDITIDRVQELLFVADSSNYRVQVFKLDGSFVRAFGSKGDGDGQFYCPIGIAVSSATRELAVSENAKGRVQVLDYNGKSLRKFGSKGTEQGQFKEPYSMAVDGAGNWLVCEYGNHRVQVFNADGSFITAFGEKGSGPGQFSGPWAVCTASDGRILVADSSNYRVQVFAF